MDFVDASGTRYQLTETAEAPAPAKKVLVWPWVMGGLALAGGLVWMASQTSRRSNPVTSEIKALIAEARDPDTSFERLVRLFKHPEIEVRRALLDNPNLCPTKADGQLDTSLLEDLAEEFPEEVAAHPVFVLHVLIEPKDEFQWVVGAVARRTKNVGLIEQVFRTCGPSSWRVRRNVAKNPSTPGNILRTLGNEATESDGGVRVAVASNPSTPVDLLRTLSNPKTESDWRVREAVATNPSTPEDTLCILGNEATESDEYVRKSVALNPSTPVDILRLLGNEKTESIAWVREAAQNALADRGLA